MMLCGLVLAAALQGGFAEVDAFTVRVKGMGTLSVEVEGEKPLAIDIVRPGSWLAGGVQKDEHRFVSYTERMEAQRQKRADRLTDYDVYSNSVVTVTCRSPKFTQNYFLLPNFNMSMGLYQHADVVRCMPRWKELYRLAPDRVYEFAFVPDPPGNRTLLYLDGCIVASMDGMRRISGAKTGRGLTLVDSAHVRRRDAAGYFELERKQMGGTGDSWRAHPALRQGATLPVPPGPQVIDGVPMTVWAPEESVDQAQHRPTSGSRTITWSPQYNRTPWATGPEFIQWTVPSRAWRYAHVLCADIPEPGKAPVIGTQLSKLGNGCTVANCATDFASLDGAATNANVKVVGSLVYAVQGERRETPLYLVRLPLSSSRLGVRGRDALTLDFEFVGAGTSVEHPRSSVQVFGCTLEPAPFSFEITNPVRGNIFEQGTDRQVGGIDFIAHLDNVRLSYSYETYDELNRVLDTGRGDVALERSGERRHVEIDLTKYGIGWYGRDYTLYGADGSVVTRHRTSFTVLAPDDREAGYESPYAAWPHLRHYHGANPDPREQLDVMRKSGYRKTWSTPLDSEEAMRPWKVTLSTAGQSFSNPPWNAKSPEVISNWIDKAIASIRQQKEKFPHVKVVQMLHETWGINICSQVVYGVKGERGRYRGWTDQCPTNRNDFMVYTCTEYAKRLRGEFPDLRIMLANGSGSSERVAQLASDGLDLALVDQLGIECKGFTSLPECGGNRESPAALWGLRETGRCFGYSNLTVNACNEYVFRTEREVPRSADPYTCLKMTGYAVRDFIISVAHGCDIVSQGHLEDPADAYYDTNWGASGLCTFYPFSYPKRMFTALAVLTRVLDRPVYRRSLPTGAGAAYALEFLRDRTVKDYAYALWTPHYGVTMRVEFPAGAKVRQVDAFGRETAADAIVDLAVDATPRYLIADRPALTARVVATAPMQLPPDARTITAINSSTVTVPDNAASLFRCGWKHVVTDRDPWGCPYPQPGIFVFRDVTDAPFDAPALELELVRKGTCPALRWENTFLRLNRPFRFRRSEIRALGVCVRGNGSFAGVQLAIRDPKRPEVEPWHIPAGDERGFVAFDGWQCMVTPVPGDRSFLGYPEYDGVDEVELVGIDCGSARQALDPVEMRPVEANLQIGSLLVFEK